MKPTERMLLLLGLLSCWLVTGCGNSQRAKLVGTWSIETADRIMQRLGDESSATDAEPVAAPKMQIIFSNNGELKTITEMGRVAPAPKNGHWEMLSFDSATQTMNIKCTIGLQESEHDVKFLDDATIMLVPPNMAGLNLQVTFKRNK